MNTQTNQSRASKWGWGILLALAALLALSSVVLYFMSASPAIFEQDTGVAMSEVRQRYPTVADQVVREGQNISILLAGMALTTLMVAWEGFRHRSRWAWNTLWVFVGMLAVVGLKATLLGGRLDIGGFYFALAAIALVGQLLARRGLAS